MLKAYVGYSHQGGAAEGAILIFAHNLKEAKRTGYPNLRGWGVDEYTDMRVEWLRDSQYLFDQVPQWSKEKLTRDEAHVIETPPTCKSCHLWGYELDENGLCECCAEEQAGNAKLEYPLVDTATFRNSQTKNFENMQRGGTI